MVKTNSLLRKIKKHQGLSLAEILVSVTIFVVAVAVLYTGFAAGNMSWRTHENTILSQREVRKVLGRMSRDLRQAAVKPGGITQDANSARIDFSLSGQGSFYYEWDSLSANPDQVIKGNASSSQVIATNISYLQFTLGTNTLLINITASASQAGGQQGSFSLKQKVSFR